MAFYVNVNLANGRALTTLLDLGVVLSCEARRNPRLAAAERCNRCFDVDVVLICAKRGYRQKFKSKFVFHISKLARAARYHHR